MGILDYLGEAYQTAQEKAGELVNDAAEYLGLDYGIEGDTRINTARQADVDLEGVDRTNPVNVNAQAQNANAIKYAAFAAGGLIVALALVSAFRK